MSYDNNGSIEPLCVPGACDIVDQNCDGGTAGCFYVGSASGVTRSCLPPGTAAEGAACPQANSCQKGLICLNGTCGKPCRTSTDCNTGSSCTVQLTLPGSGERPTFCAPSCDPLNQSTCATSQGCYFTGSGSACLPAGQGDAGTTCNSPTQCKRGSTCASSSGTGPRCVDFCRFPSGTPACSSGTCNRVTQQDGGALGDGSVGVCI